MFNRNKAEKIKRKRTPLFTHVRFLIIITLWLYFVQWLFWYEPIHIHIPFGQSIEVIMGSTLSFIWLPFAIRYIRQVAIGRKFIVYFLVLIAISLIAIITSLIFFASPLGPCVPMYEEVGDTRFYIRTDNYFCWYGMF